MYNSSNGMRGVVLRTSPTMSIPAKHQLNALASLRRRHRRGIFVMFQPCSRRVEKLAWGALIRVACVRVLVADCV